ncbi:hypothetical protein [Neobacillus sp. YIM B06451]|uniref:hypothetical protein n=1 Tax=Neobacillus sp. YIM B06451 TaxID=3070994 RepID=UPI002930C8F5|nr:hypothetical protein [Neobacillus sp. YIM B06451]
MNLRQFFYNGINMNMLKAKQFLIQNKRHGYLFYQPQIVELQTTDSFDLFFYLCKPKDFQSIAFPIPTSVYKNGYHYSDAPYYFADYFGTNYIPDVELFLHMEVYEGIEWSWIYQPLDFQTFDV